MSYSTTYLLYESPCVDNYHYTICRSLKSLEWHIQDIAYPKKVKSPSFTQMLFLFVSPSQNALVQMLMEGLNAVESKL
jgi:hypothetical protein